MFRRNLAMIQGRSLNMLNKPSVASGLQPNREAASKKTVSFKNEESDIRDEFSRQLRSNRINGGTQKEILTTIQNLTLEGLSTLVSLNPQSAFLHYMLGIAQSRHEDLDGSIASLRRSTALKKDPDVVLFLALSLDEKFEKGELSDRAETKACYEYVKSYSKNPENVQKATAWIDKNFPS